MKNTFEKTTEASRNGYIADQNSIDWIIGKLLDIPLIDFRCVSSEILMKLLADFMRDSGMNEFRSHQVTFGEMLGMTELILFLFTDGLSLHYMLSKAIATAVVLVWNYLARKLLLYKN